MELNTITALIVPIVTASIAAAFQLPAARKNWSDLRHSRRDRRKQESEFAAKFAERCGDPNVKRYAEEYGYAALIGDAHLSFEERKLLLKFKDSERTIDRYLRTYRLVQVHLSQHRLVWKRKRHEIPRYRILVRLGFVAGYVFWSLFAATPWFLRAWLPGFQHLPGNMLAAMAVWTMSVGIPYAILCANRASMLKEAASLIAEQRLNEDVHLSPVVLTHDRATSRSDGPSTNSDRLSAQPAPTRANC